MKKDNSNFKKWSALFLVVAMHFSFVASSQTTVIYNESFGSPESNTNVNIYLGYDNTNVIYSDNSTGVDIRKTESSTPSNYSFASGNGNVFLGSSTNGEKTFEISNIDILGANGLELKFGLRKSTNASNGTELSISAIVDNGAPISLNFNELPTGSNTSKWYGIEITNMADVPTGNFLTLIFNKTNSSTQMRIDDIILSKNNDPTPVTLSSFQANYQQGIAKLLWKTSTEINTAYFAVERSRDGKSFQEIGKVTAQNIRNGASYQFEDSQLPMAEKLFYRLKMVDIDKKYEYSPISSIWLTDSKNANIRLQGNLVKEQLVLLMNQAEEGIMNYQIIDLNGKVYDSNQWMQKGRNNVEININNLSSGFYILKVNGDHQQQTFKFVKQ